MAEAALVTVPHVPIAIVGVDYPASTGPITFSPEDLIAAVAAVDDPEIRQPTLKLGHSGPLTSDQPVFGKLMNLAYEADSQTLFADLVGVPAWLAEVMPYVYPSRSVEGWKGYKTQHTEHQFVLSGLSLLGEAWPGVTNLDDLPTMFGAEIPEIALDIMEAELKVKLAAGGVHASMPVDEIRTAFYKLPDVASNYAFWVSQILVDPNEIIVRDDDEGALFRVPFAVNGNEVEFGDWQPVRIEYVDAVTAKRTEATRHVFATKGDSRPQTDKKENRVNIAKLARWLGLSSDATEQEVNEALENHVDSEPPVLAGQTDENDTTDGDDTEDDSAAESTEPVAAKGTVNMSREEYDELRKQAGAGAAAFEQMRAAERDAAIAAAVKAGKISPAMRASYTKFYDRDPEACRAELAELPEGLVPVKEIGGQPDGAVEAAAYNETWLSPGERARIAAARNGAVGTTDEEAR